MNISPLKPIHGIALLICIVIYFTLDIIINIYKYINLRKEASKLKYNYQTVIDNDVSDVLDVLENMLKMAMDKYYTNGIKTFICALLTCVVIVGLKIYYKLDMSSMEDFNIQKLFIIYAFCLGWIRAVFPAFYPNIFYYDTKQASDMVKSYYQYKNEQETLFYNRQRQKTEDIFQGRHQKLEQERQERLRKMQEQMKQDRIQKDREYQEQLRQRWEKYKQAEEERRKQWARERQEKWEQRQKQERVRQEQERTRRERAQRERTWWDQDKQQQQRQQQYGQSNTHADNAIDSTLKKLFEDKGIQLNYQGKFNANEYRKALRAIRGLLHPDKCKGTYNNIPCNDLFTAIDNYLE